jgi:FMN phosphatase YigB (HAD superfamily)
MRYRAVLFDLFDTLVRFDRQRLPVIEVGGHTVRSTAGHLHAALVPYAPDVSLERCYWALAESWKEADRLRAIDHREVAAAERFRDFFRRLGLDGDGVPADVATRLIETHRWHLAAAAEFPPHHVALLRELAGRFRLAVVSNFDYTPTAVGILEAAGVAALFETIVVSDAVGWRKPRREIFDAALGRLALGPADALFVGDRAEIDVAGAQAMGMDAAWLNPAAVSLPTGVARPAWELRDLAELRAVLAA